MDQVVVKWLIDREFCERAAKKRRRHVSVTATESLGPKIDLLLDNAVKIPVLSGNADGLCCVKHSVPPFH
jgi:hypothetical protein